MVKIIIITPGGFVVFVHVCSGPCDISKYSNPTRRFPVLSISFVFFPSGSHCQYLYKFCVCVSSISTPHQHTQSIPHLDLNLYQYVYVYVFVDFYSDLDLNLYVYLYPYSCHHSLREFYFSSAASVLAEGRA